MNKKIKEAYNNVKFDEARKEEILDVLLSECEKKENYNMNRNMSKVAVAAIIFILLSVPVGVYAAKYYLSAKNVAEELGSNELARLFDDSNIIDSMEDGDYRFLYLGNASAKLEEAFLENGNATYIALAVERIDGEAISENETFVASPLIEGNNPMEYNIYTLGGGATWKTIDGVSYMIMAVKSMESFVDKQAYLAITTGPDYATAFSMDEKTGLISSNKNFDGINVLFDVSLDYTNIETDTADEVNNKADDNSDILLNVDNYENIISDNATVESMIHQDNVVCIDNYEFELDGEYYSVDYENEYGSNSGIVHKDMYEVDNAMLQLWYAEEDSDKIIYEYSRRDKNDVLHIKHYEFDK